MLTRLRSFALDAGNNEGVEENQTWTGNQDSLEGIRNELGGILCRPVISNREAHSHEVQENIEDFEPLVAGHSVEFFGATALSFDVVAIRV